MSYGTSYTPSGADAPVKLRGPLFVGVASLLTLGLYLVYWTYETAKHLRDVGRAHGRDLGQKPGMTLLAMTAGWLVVVPPFVAMFRQARRIQQAQHLAGVPAMNGWLAFVLFVVVTPVYGAYAQAELNRVWAADGAPVPTPSYDAPPLAA